jgi:hypothetical protein
MKKDIIIISGVSGLTGNFAYKLIKRDFKNYKVVGFTRNTTSNKSYLPDQTICADASDSNDWEDIMTYYKPKVVIIISNIRHFLPFQKALENIKTSNKNYKDPRLILVGTTGVFSKKKEYSFLYKKIEKELKSKVKNYVLLRPSLIYGSHRDKNMYRLIKFINRYKFFLTFGNGENTLQPVYYKDVSWSIYKSLTIENLKGEFNITGKECITYKKMLLIVFGKLNLKPRIIRVPIWPSILIAKIIETLFREKSPIRSEQIERLQENKCFSNSRSVDLINYEPTEFGCGIEKQIMFMREKKLI